MLDPAIAYISGTVLESGPHREAVVNACVQQDLIPRLTETISSGLGDAVERARQQVDRAAVYIAVMAHRYGYIPPGSDRSIIELEYDRAVERGIPHLVFLMHDEHQVRLSEVDTGELAEKLRAFKDRCRRDQVVADYRSPDDLREQVLSALIPFRPAGSATVSATPYARERGEYLKRLAELWRWIDLGGLAPQVGGELLRLPLDAIFIHLHAERDMPRIESMAREEFLLRRELEREGAGDEEVARRMDRLALKELMPRDRSEPDRRERIDVVEVLKRPRSVVLGDPGSGKTTFLRYLARALALRDRQLIQLLGAEWLPVYIRLGEYDEHCEGNRRISLFEFAPVAARARDLPLPPELLANEARAGRCLFLLDGLDEILVTTNRASIRDRIEELARAYPNCRIVATSRIVGYRNAELPRGDGGFSHFTLSPFDDAEIRRFAAVWYDAIRTTGELSDPSRQNAEVLAKGIAGNPGIRRLATNPLLMTLIALTYWREVRLPRRRVELYGNAARMLLRNWLRLRTPSVALDERETTSLLMGIAFHMHLTSSAGLITRTDLEKVVRSLKVERGGLAAEEASKAVEDFIGTQEQHVGLLQPRGLNDRNETVYGFLHLTFEEYFTARELARLWKQGRFSLHPYLHRPRWEEPILLAAAYLSDEDDDRHPNAFVREILDAQSPYEKELHRDLFLAASCLADDVVVARELADRIFDELGRVFSSSIVPLNNRISEILASMTGTRYQLEAVGASLNKLRSESQYVREAVAAALGRMGTAGAPDVVAALKALLRDPDPGSRAAAAQALGAMGAAAGPDVIAALKALLRDPDPGPRAAAARALGGMGAAAGSELITALISLLRDPEWFPRAAAAEALRGMGAAAGSELIAALIPLLHDPDPGSRDAAARTLGAMGAAAGPELIAALIPLLRDPDPGPRDAAARALGAMGTAAGPDVIAVLMALLHDPDWRPRGAAARALGGMGAAAGSESITALISLLRDPEWFPRAAAAEALGGMGTAAGPELIAALIPLLRDPDEYTRGRAAEALGRSGAVPEPQVIAALISLLRDSDWFPRGAAALALGRIGTVPEPELIAALVVFLRDPETYPRGAAAEALGMLGEAAATQVVLDRLSETIYSAEARGKWLEDAAFRSLSRLVQFYEQPTGIESISTDLPATRISTATAWKVWLTDDKVSGMPPSLAGGLPALQVLKVRLRNIKAYADTGVVGFIDTTSAMPRPWSLLLGENATGKSTFLRCIALAANGLGLANEIETRAASYRRIGANTGFIEVLFGLRFSHDPSTAEMVEIPVGLEIRDGESAFRTIERTSEMTFGKVIPADRLGLLRNQTNIEFGIVCGYGATRGLTDESSELVGETGKVAIDRVRPLFSPFAKLINPDVLGKMLATGDLSNFVNAPPALDPTIREAIDRRLVNILPGVGEFSSADPSGIALDEVRIPLRDLSDGYGGLLALVGHLVHHALRLTGWSADPAEVSGLVLIDEIDLHLHPAWQRRVIRDLAEAFPRLQFIATSHSPIVAGGVADESLLVLKPGEAGTTVSSDAASVKGCGADQILTSDLFGLPTSRSIEAEELMTKYAWLLNKRGPSDPEVRFLGNQLAPILSSDGEGPVDEETYRLLQKLVDEQFRELKPEVRSMMLGKASLILSSKGTQR